MTTFGNRSNQCALSLQRSAKGLLKIALSTVSSFERSVKKHLHFYLKITVPIAPTIFFSYSFLFCRRNKGQKPNFQQVGGLVTRIFSVFCLKRVTLNFKAMPNSMDFYKGIFLHVISV